MAKIANAKVKLLYIADYIVRNSDDENGFYITEIKDYLASKGIKAEYHSITDDIKLLRDQFGMDIDGGGGNGRPFYLLSHHFAFEDISAIAECIGSANFISEKEAHRLTGILKELCSEEQAKKIDRDYFISDRPRDTQEDLNITLGVIRDAIKNNAKISFRYTKSTINATNYKYRIYRRKGESYIVSPYKVVLYEGNHYLIGYNEKRNVVSAFRMSRIDGIKIVYKPRVGEEVFRKYEIEDYPRQTFNMFIGPRVKEITLVCSNSLLDTMIERFGTKEAWYKKIDEEHFSIRTKIVVSPAFYGWLCGLGGQAIIEDSGEEDSVAKKYIDYLEKMRDKQLKSVE